MTNELELKRDNASSICFSHFGITMWIFDGSVWGDQAHYYSSFTINYLCVEIKKEEALLFVIAYIASCIQISISVLSEEAGLACSVPTLARSMSGVTFPHLNKVLSFHLIVV